MSDERNEIVATEALPPMDGALEVELILGDQVAGKLGGRSLTNLANKTPEARLRLYNARQGTHPKLDTIIGKQIDVCGFVASMVEIEDEVTGELVKVPLTRIVCADGAIYQTASPVVLRHLVEYHTEVRPGPWTPPVTFEVQQRAGKPPRKFFALHFVSDHGLFPKAAMKRKA